MIDEETQALLNAQRKPGEADDVLIARLINTVAMGSRLRDKLRTASIKAEFFPDGRMDDVATENAKREIMDAVKGLPLKKQVKLINKVREHFWPMGIDTATLNAVETSLGTFTAKTANEHISAAINQVFPLCQTSEQRDLLLRAQVVGGTSAILATRGVIDEILSLKQQLASVDNDIHDVLKRQERTASIIKAEIEVLQIAANPVLQKLGESGWHKCVTAYRKRELLQPRGFPALEPSFYHYGCEAPSKADAHSQAGQRTTRR